MIIYKILIICVLLLYCSNHKSEHSLEESHLISSTSSFVMEDGEEATGYYTDRTSFIKPYVSSKYSGDTLFVTTLHEVNSCAENIGIIKFSNDTLYLLTEQKGDEVCSSVEFYKFLYIIERKNINNYNIMY